MSDHSCVSSWVLRFVDERLAFDELTSVVERLDLGNSEVALLRGDELEVVDCDVAHGIAVFWAGGFEPAKSSAGRL